MWNNWHFKNRKGYVIWSLTNIRYFYNICHLLNIRRSWRMLIVNIFYLLVSSSLLLISWFTHAPYLDFTSCFNAKQNLCLFGHIFPPLGWIPNLLPFLLWYCFLYHPLPWDLNLGESETVPHNFPSLNLGFE